jgi:dihydroxy-acid dehydratase
MVAVAGFSGGFHGLVFGHVAPEAQVGGPIVLLVDGGMVTIDAIRNTLTAVLSDEVLSRRKAAWRAPEFKVTGGILKSISKRFARPLRTV